MMFSTKMQATVRVPQEGFTQAELKAHLSASKIPADARLVPTLVRFDVDPEQGGVTYPDGEIALVAEWSQ